MEGMRVVLFSDGKDWCPQPSVPPCPAVFQAADAAGGVQQRDHGAPAGSAQLHSDRAAQDVGRECSASLSPLLSLIHAYMYRNDAFHFVFTHQ